MKKKLLSGLCAGALFCSVSLAQASFFGPGYDFEAKKAAKLVAFAAGGAFSISAATVCGLVASICTVEKTVELYRNWLSVDSTQQFLEGTSGSDECQLLQVIKSVNFDVNKAVKVVTTYCLANAVDSSYCELCQSCSCNCRERKRFNAIKAVKDLDNLFTALSRVEGDLFGKMQSWFCSSSTSKKYKSYLNEISKLKMFVAEVIGAIKESDLYMCQLVDHEKLLKEKRVRELENREYDIKEIEARAERKIISYNGLPANASVQLVQKEESSSSRY